MAFYGLVLLWPRSIMFSIDKISGVLELPGFSIRSFPEEPHLRFPTGAAFAVSRRSRIHDLPQEPRSRFPEIANAMRMP